MTLREEHRLRMLNYATLKSKLVRIKEDIIGVWRNTHNELLHNLFSCSNTNTIKKMFRALYVARMGKKINAYRFSVGKPKGKRQLLRNTCRLENKIKMNLRERG